MAPCYCIILRRAARKTTAIYDEALEPLGINIAQFSLMRRVQAVGPVSLTELARYLDLDRSTVGRNVKVLARMGLLDPVSSEDHREATIMLSDAGKSRLAEAVPVWQTAQDRIETRFGGHDGAEQLQSLLKAL